MRSVGFMGLAVLFLLVLISLSDSKRPSFGKGKFKPGKGKPGFEKGKPCHGKGKQKPPYYKTTTTVSPGSSTCDTEAIKYKKYFVL